MKQGQNKLLVIGDLRLICILHLHSAVVRLKHREEASLVVGFQSLLAICFATDHGHDVAQEELEKLPTLLGRTSEVVHRTVLGRSQMKVRLLRVGSRQSSCKRFVLGDMEQIFDGEV
jgi:hypothetical protein